MLYSYNGTYFEKLPLLREKNVASDRWPLVTGSVVLSDDTLSQKVMVFQDR